MGFNNRAYWAKKKADEKKKAEARAEDAKNAPPNVPTAFSQYQKDIFSDVANGCGHTIVMARAGCGKTTTIVEALKFVPSGTSWLLAAFNKSIAEELKERAPANGEVTTLHSLGFKACLKHFGSVSGKRPELDKNKTQKLAQALVGPEPEKFDYVQQICKAVSLAKGWLAETAERIDEIIDQYGIETDGAPNRGQFIQVVLGILKMSKTQTSMMDFDDMIWFPNVFEMTMPKFGMVFVDETQDLNRAQIEMIKKCMAPGGRIVAVGDDRQAIYGFRGADSDSMENLRVALDAKILPLSVTYRCGKSIVAEANKIVPDLEAAPSAPDGEVSEVSYDDMKKKAQPGDFILSRTNAPMIGLAMAFIKDGRPCNIQGRDIGANLLYFIKKSKKTDVGSFMDYVSEWRDKECERLVAKNRDTTAVQDKAACLLALCNGALTLDDVKKSIEKLFQDGDDKNRIILSTTHKAKGLERERVWLLSATYKPGRNREEDNLWYVAVTRAKRNLNFVRGLKAEAMEE